MRNEKFGIVFKRELIYNSALRTPHSAFLKMSVLSVFMC